MKMLSLLALSLTTLSLACTPNHSSDMSQLTSAEVAMPAQQLLAVARKVVTSPPYNLTIEEENKGRFVTSYQNFQGDWHIVRYWPQRSRYIVTVAPDFDHPADHCRVEVTIDTEQQAAGATVDGQPKWTHDTQIDHPERAANMTEAIRNAAASASPSK